MQTTNCEVVMKNRKATEVARKSWASNCKEISMSEAANCEVVRKGGVAISEVIGGSRAASCEAVRKSRAATEVERNSWAGYCEVQ